MPKRSGRGSRRRELRTTWNIAGEPCLRSSARLRHVPAGSRQRRTRRADLEALITHVGDRVSDYYRHAQQRDLRRTLDCSADPVELGAGGVCANRRIRAARRIRRCRWRHAPGRESHSGHSANQRAGAARAGQEGPHAAAPIPTRCRQSRWPSCFPPTATSIGSPRSATARRRAAPR